MNSQQTKLANRRKAEARCLANIDGKDLPRWMIFGTKKRLRKTNWPTHRGVVQVGGVIVPFDRRKELVFEWLRTRRLTYKKVVRLLDKKKKRSGR